MGKIGDMERREYEGRGEPTQAHQLTCSQCGIKFNEGLLDLFNIHPECKRCTQIKDDPFDNKENPYSPDYGENRRPPGY